MADIEDPYDGCDEYDSDDEDEDELVECPPPTTKLIEKEQGLMEDISKFMKPNFDKETRKQRQEWDDEEDFDQTIFVALSNKADWKPRCHIHYQPWPKCIQRMAKVPMDDYGVVRLEVGTDITVMSGDKVVQQWKVTPKSHQILSASNLWGCKLRR